MINHLMDFPMLKALYLLQNTSLSVRLKVWRYLDGIKYEKIQDMIGSSNRTINLY